VPIIVLALIGSLFLEEVPLRTAASRAPGEAGQLDSAPIEALSAGL
jgi:hypothetical protein